MNKLEVQKRVLQNGKPLDLEKFEWDEEAKVFSSAKNYLVIDFGNINDCTFATGHSCTFETGSDCVVVRRDIYQVIELKEGKRIKLNGYRINGFNVLKTKEEIITVNGVKYKKIEDE